MKDIKSLNILIVEDDLDVRARVAKDVKELGFEGELHLAGDGIEALEKLHETSISGKTIDLVICDIFMPKMTGIEFLEEIRDKDSPYKKLPVLMLTTKSERSLIINCIKLGVGQYLLKPWDKKSLMVKIKATLDKDDEA
jgi:CheY-like chemotaxis protein